MMKNEFKVIFRLPRALPALKPDQEFDVKYFDGDWYFKIPGIISIIFSNTKLMRHVVFNYLHVL